MLCSLCIECLVKIIWWIVWWNSAKRRTGWVSSIRMKLILSCGSIRKIRKMKRITSCYWFYNFLCSYVHLLFLCVYRCVCWKDRINKNEGLSWILVINDHCSHSLIVLIINNHYTYIPRKLKVRWKRVFLFIPLMRMYLNTMTIRLLTQFWRMDKYINEVTSRVDTWTRSRRFCCFPTQQSFNH